MISGDGNIIALAALLLAPFASFILFKSLSIPLAAALTLIGGYLLLPTQPVFDLPVLPPLDKTSIPVFSVLLFGTMAIAREKALRRPGLAGRNVPQKKREQLEVLPGWLPGGFVARLMIFGLIASTFWTGFRNPETLFVGGTRVLPGFTLYSTFSMALSIGVLLLPILIGRRLFAFPNGQKTLLTVLALGAFAYSFLALVEVRLSPQLNVWIYGFFPHSFAQHVRAGGYRPLVFMSHGLWLAIFMCMGLLAAFGAYRARIGTFNTPGVWLGIGAWLMLTLLLSNSLGAFVLAFLAAPLVLFLNTRTQLLIAALVGVMILSYPILRERGLVPTQALVNISASIDSARAGSLQYRFENEDILLDRAREKLDSGWGLNGRNLIYEDYFGKIISTIDGYWIIAFGVGGLPRYVFEYGLLTFAFWQLLFRARTLSLGPETAILALMLTVNLVDMLLNATMTLVTGVLAGALIGRLEIARYGLLDQQNETEEIKRGGRMRHRSQQGKFVPAGAVAAGGPSAPASPSVEDAPHVRRNDETSSGSKYSRFEGVADRQPTRGARPEAAVVRPRLPQKR